MEKRSKNTFQGELEKKDRKINVMPNSEFIEIRERILHSFFNSIKEDGKFDNPS